MQLDSSSIIQVLILAGAIYVVMSFVRTARGSSLVRGLAFALLGGAMLFMWLSRRLELEVLAHMIQGAGPGANEYMGDGPYTRDEILDRSHLRGTVGISTRGRDTGDSQLFVNLVDNVRLDHNFTIIGVIVNGMDVVDQLLEGATIERVTIELETGG